MLPNMGLPYTVIYEYPHRDTSWSAEFAASLTDIHANRTPSASLYNAYEALKIVRAVYSQSGYDLSGSAVGDPDAPRVICPGVSRVPSAKRISSAICR